MPLILALGSGFTTSPLGVALTTVAHLGTLFHPVAQILAYSLPRQQEESAITTSNTWVKQLAEIRKDFELILRYITKVTETSQSPR
jgi:hypothetical protein